jgi:hypothetical protein
VEADDENVWWRVKLHQMIKHTKAFNILSAESSSVCNKGLVETKNREALGKKLKIEIMWCKKDKAHSTTLLYTLVLLTTEWN